MNTTELLVDRDLPAEPKLFNIVGGCSRMTMAQGMNDIALEMDDNGKGAFVLDDGKSRLEGGKDCFTTFRQS